MRIQLAPRELLALSSRALEEGSCGEGSIGEELLIQPLALVRLHGGGKRATFGSRLDECVCLLRDSRRGRTLLAQCASEG